METIRLAIVILNWNGKHFLEKFLPSVIAHSPSYAQIVVADNASTDHSVEFLNKNFPGIEILSFDKNYGYTGGYNRALKMISSQYYVLLNSDIEVGPLWIEPIIELMDSDLSIAACQPAILDHKDPCFYEYAGAAGGYIDKLGYPFCRGRIFDTLEEVEGQYEESADVFWATGACLFVRSQDFHNAGGLDEDFFAHMEEIDLCWRLKRMGKRIMCVPASRVYHVGGGTLPKNNPRKTFLNFRNNLLLLAKNTSTTTFYPLLLKRMFLDEVAALTFLLKGQWKDFVAVYRALFVFLGMFRSKRKQGKAYPLAKVSPVFKKSIVIQYFLLGRKKFTDLDSGDFGHL